MKLVMRKSGDLLKLFPLKGYKYGLPETKRRNTAAASFEGAAVFICTYGDFAFSINLCI